MITAEVINHAIDKEIDLTRYTTDKMWMVLKYNPKTKVYTIKRKLVGGDLSESEMMDQEIAIEVYNSLTGCEQ